MGGGPEERTMALTEWRLVGQQRRWAKAGATQPSVFSLFSDFQDQSPRMEKECSTVIKRMTGVRGNGMKTY